MAAFKSTRANIGVQFLSEDGSLASLHTAPLGVLQWSAARFQQSHDDGYVMTDDGMMVKPSQGQKHVPGALRLGSDRKRMLYARGFSRHLYYRFIMRHPGLIFVLDTTSEAAAVHVAEAAQKHDVPMLVLYQQADGMPLDTFHQLLGGATTKVAQLRDHTEVTAAIDWFYEELEGIEARALEEKAQQKLKLDAAIEAKTKAVVTDASKSLLVGADNATANVSLAA
eukprot:m.82303 g.82303  ORF g.82303 m.82303 type:complete len:225 (+) comp14613_c1_seq2:33-707(+)